MRVLGLAHHWQRDWMQAASHHHRDSPEAEGMDRGAAPGHAADAVGPGGVERHLVGLDHALITNPVPIGVVRQDAERPRVASSSP